MSWTGDQEYPGISIIGQPQPEVEEDETPTRKHFSKLPAKTLTFDEEL